MDTIKKNICDYYTQKITQHGATPTGVDWNENGQDIRFAQQSKLIADPQMPYSIVDYGCGYGAFATYLAGLGHQFTYEGIDLSAEMIEEARRHCNPLPSCSFTVGDTPAQPADYAVASGLFNVKMDTDQADWEAHIRAVLDSMHQHSTKGFAFNSLTSYSDPEYMRDDLYYGDPCMWFDYCKKNFSRNVALLHDYEIYDFTILVRK